jgi:phospholipase/lecithinase/hemolysin
MSRLFNVVLAVLVSVAFVSQADAGGWCRVSGLVVFGDSNVDMGFADPNGDSAADYTGGALFPAPNVGGRSCNGPVVVEYVADSLEVPLSNYAVGGATSGTMNLIALLVPHPMFEEAYDTGVLNQLAKFEESLVHGRADKKAVYLIWAGSNDLFGASAATAPASVDQAIANIDYTVNRLNELGASNILVATRTTRPDLYSEDNINGVLFNSALRVEVEALQDSLKANVQIFEAFDYITDMMYNPEDYGLTNTTDLCFDDLTCSSDPEVAAGYVSWDAPHKTTRVHEILSEFMVDQICKMGPPCGKGKHK